VRLREALGNSLNVPAVHTAAQLGPATLLRVLHAFGFDSLEQKPEYYGPALALGDGEVTLLELVRAYATLARGGAMLPLRFVLDEDTAELESTGLGARGAVPVADETRVTRAGTSALITDILRTRRRVLRPLAPFPRCSLLGRSPPRQAPQGLSRQLGHWLLSSLHRGVWVGNFDGSSMQRVSGITVRRRSFMQS